MLSVAGSVHSVVSCSNRFKLETPVSVRIFVMLKNQTRTQVQMHVFVAWRTVSMGKIIFAGTLLQWHWLQVNAGQICKCVLILCHFFVLPLHKLLNFLLSSDMLVVVLQHFPIFYACCQFFWGQALLLIIVPVVNAVDTHSNFKWLVSQVSDNCWIVKQVRTCSFETALLSREQWTLLGSAHMNSVRGCSFCNKVGRQLACF